MAGIRYRVALRVAGIVLCTGSAFALGIASDSAAGRPALLTEVTAAFLLAPFAVPIGALGVDVSVGRGLLLVGGILFWPVWGFLVWKLVKAPRWWYWAALLVWNAQGFFQIVHRLDVVMSA